MTPAGTETLYNYTGDKLTSVLDHAGRETAFFYTDDHLTEVLYPDGTSQTYKYDIDGLLIREVNQRGIATNYKYNQWKRLTQVEHVDNSKIEIFDSGSATVGNNYTGGNVGQLKKLGEGEAIDGIIDPKQNVTVMKKDESGFVNTIIDSAGRELKIDRDLNGRPIKITRFEDDNVTIDSETIFTYDELGDLRKKEDTGTGVALTYSYTPEGRLKTQDIPGGGQVINDYDPETGLLIRSTNQLGQAIVYTYYPSGLLKSRKDSLGQTVFMEYDVFGNLTVQYQLVDGVEENRVEFIRDTAGNVTKITNAKNQVTLREYDSMNRLKAVTTPKNEKTHYEYIPTGQLEKIIDPLGNITKFVINEMGRLVKKIDPLGFETLLDYDANGNIKKEIDPNGNIKKFVYDNLDKLRAKILPDNHYVYDYDVRGNLTSISDNDSKITLNYERNEVGYFVNEETFEGLGNLSNMASYTLSYDYDVSGNRELTETPFGNFAYSYDVGNRLRALTNHKNEVFTFDYDNGNRLAKIARPGSETLYSFDQTNFLEKIQHKQLGTGNVISQFNYIKDAIGNRAEKHTSTDTEKYDYDSNNQITSVQDGSDDILESFDYDSIGNRTQDVLQNYSYDGKRQRIIEDSLYLYYHDNNGNMTARHSKTSDKVVQYIYSSENQLIQIKWYNGTTLTKEATYSFDALGRRVQKEIVDHQNLSKSFTRRFVYDGNEVLAQLDESNNALSVYTHSTLRTDDVLAVDVTSEGKNNDIAVSDGSFYHLKDGLGSITLLTSSAGNSVQRLKYNIFGTITSVLDGMGSDISGSPSLIPFFSFTNRILDNESNLYDFRARMYEPNLGRFLSEDPAREGLNHYSYVLNNPTNRVDPTGEFSLKGALHVMAGMALMGPLGGVLAANLSSEFSDKEKDYINIATIITLSAMTGGTAGAAAGGGIPGAIGGATVGGFTGSTNWRDFVCRPRRFFFRWCL